MKPADLAAEFAFDLYNDAEFVARQAKAAEIALRHGDTERATEFLRSAHAHAGNVAWRHRDALRQAEVAASEAAS